MLNVVKNTAVAIAPVMGSYITLYFHWHGNFMMAAIFRNTGAQHDPFFLSLISS